jgi:polyhydroxyalkanoate synthesis repressor PhaR
MPDMAGEADRPEPIRIRKYPNRRYYDATHSRHVTLEEIHQIIRDGRDVAVTDSRSGEDITAKVLAQIIIELDPLKLDVFPAAMLHGIIRSNEQLITDFVDKYFNQALTAFLESKRAYEQFLRRSMGLGADAAGPQDPRGPAQDWLRMMMPGLWPEHASPPQASGGSDELQRTVEALRKQVTELHARLDAKPTQARKPRSRRRP